MLRLLAMAWMVIGLILSPGLGLANSRLALVFGIDKYDHLPDLANAGNDARAVSDKLNALGFEVMLREGATRREIYRALDRFESRLADGGGTGMVFFAGHGIQADGRNYLIPADALVEVESDLEAEAINAGRILESMARAGNPLNILVLDACRDNPLPRRTRSANRGLTVTNIPSGAKGTAILYAAGEGQAAQDGPPGGHGVFTESLLAALDKPNLKLEEVIKQVTRGVLERTDGYQRPWSLASIQGDFVFNQKAVVTDLSAVEPTLDHRLEEALRQKEAELEALRANSSTELEEARRLRAEAEATRLQSEEEAERIRLEIETEQKRIQEEAQAKLQEERARMQAEFAQTAEQLKEARRRKDEAEAARIAAESRLALLSASRTTEPGTDSAMNTAVKLTAEVRNYGPHEMVLLEADCYLMGSQIGSVGRGTDESAHQVCLDGFLIDRHEVTFDAYDEFAKATDRALPDDDAMGRGRRPVINVDWDDAWSYARWASERYGIRFRLPTEAEWEYACRSGGLDQEYCGDDDPNKVAVFWSDETLPVGSKNPNLLGIYDMSGNAWEMTCSPYDGDGALSFADYAGSEKTCVEKYHHRSRSLVFRGGGWDSDASEIRSRKRRVNVVRSGGSGWVPSYVLTLGFRLAADLD